nr:Trp biosynthesis-associated membrane protein [Microbacterium amylolyticum]
MLIGGALAVISSTQTWATAHVDDIAIPAAGSEALPLLQPLSLAALALALALTLVGKVLRYVLGVLAVILGGGLGALSFQMALVTPVAALQPVVTDHTGIMGDESVAALVDAVSVTAWPWFTVLFSVLIAAGGVLALVTGSQWRQGGRRYDAAASREGAEDGRALDAVNSWDDLSRGDDPTRSSDTPPDPPRGAAPQA